MATKSLFNRAEGPPEPSRVSSVSSQFSDAAQASPSSHSSTPSWCEEPAQANMDISTGHMILVRTRPGPRGAEGSGWWERQAGGGRARARLWCPCRLTWRTTCGTRTAWPRSGKPCVPTRQNLTPAPPPRGRATSKRTATLTSCPVSESCWRTWPSFSLVEALEGLGEGAGLLAQAKRQKCQDPNDRRGMWGGMRGLCR